MTLAIAIIASLNAFGTALALYILRSLDRRIERLETLAMTPRPF